MVLKTWKCKHKSATTNHHWVQAQTTNNSTKSKSGRRKIKGHHCRCHQPAIINTRTHPQHHTQPPNSKQTPAKPYPATTTNHWSPNTIPSRQIKTKPSHQNPKLNPPTKLKTKPTTDNPPIHIWEMRPERY